MYNNFQIKVRFFLFLFSVSVCQISRAEDSVGIITKFRASTASTLNSAAQRGIIIFRLDTALDPRCTWIGLEKDNAYFASSLLSAHARSQKVRVWYDAANPMGSICWAYTLELIP